MNPPKKTDYIFIPLKTNYRFFEMMIDNLKHSQYWIEKPLELNYFLHYISNKVDGLDITSRCYHYLYKKEKLDIINTACKKATHVKESISKNRHGSFSFVPEEVELFLFSTGICILIFRVTVDAETIDELVNARAALKMISTSRYHSEVRKKSFSLSQIAEEILKDINDFFPIGIFHFMNEKNTTAYLLTLAYSDFFPDDSTLFHLQYNIDNERDLSRDIISKKLNCFSVNSHILWCVSDQSAACICADYHGNDFLENTFPVNFCREYKYLFVFLLHQKYTLYYFLTLIDTDLKNNVQKLTEYKKRLSEYKTNYVFSQISEVINYQFLYDEVTKAFNLKRMYEDVEEPLIMLDDIIRRDEEKKNILQQIRSDRLDKEQETRENHINILLALLSLLGLISAVVDAGELAKKIDGTLLSLSNQSILQYIGSHWFLVLIELLIVGWSISIIVRIKRKKKENMNKLNNCLYLGVFFDSQVITEHLHQIDRHQMEKSIKYSHVTVKYKPKDIPFHLFGEPVSVIVTGYGYNSTNEGVTVKLISENEELNQIFSQIPNPHITLSVSKNGQPKDTSSLHFTPVKAFEFKGVFGAMTKEHKIITDNVISDR